MDKEIKRRSIKQKPYVFIIDVEYIPFPSEEKRREAYYTHAKLFLRAKERELREKGLFS
jgi:hypothetical protein